MSECTLLEFFRFGSSAALPSA
ncbi:hypothetical protein A2U01_0100954, partial [Trifolium medium]|nr:hypothetical protein [Trifolium medium]